MSRRTRYEEYPGTYQYRLEPFIRQLPKAFPSSKQQQRTGTFVMFAKCVDVARPDNAGPQKWLRCCAPVDRQTVRLPRMEIYFNKRNMHSKPQYTQEFSDHARCHALRNDIQQRSHTALKTVMPVLRSIAHSLGNESKDTMSATKSNMKKHMCASQHQTPMIYIYASLCWAQQV